MNIEYIRNNVINVGNFQIELEEKDAIELLIKIAIAANNHEKAKKQFERGRACGVKQSIMKDLNTDLYDAEMALTGALINGKVFGLFNDVKECGENHD